MIRMEALKTLYAPGFQRLLTDVPRIGKIVEVDAAFTKLVDDKSNRVYKENMAGGSFSELASYPLIPVMKILGHDCERISFYTFRDRQSGVDVYTKAVLEYRENIADIRTGIGAKTEGNLVVAGTKGYILAPSPWWLTKTYDICYEDRSRNEHVEVPFEGDGLRYEIRHFAGLVSAGKTASEEMKKDSLFLAGVMEEFFKERATGKKFRCV